MENIRKRTMRCKHQTSCNLCLADCRRAEIIAKEDEIKDDLLAASERVRSWLNEEHKEKLTKSMCEDILFAVLKKTRGE